MKNVLLIGASQMAVDYYNVLRELPCEVTVLGRGAASAETFEKATGKKPVCADLDEFLNSTKIKFDSSIVSVGVEQLAPVATTLMNHSFKKILLEKPAGMNDREIEDLAAIASERKVNLFIAYNRRFYSSLLKAKEIIEKDGGVTSFHFEFTEWADTIYPLDKKPGIKENWFMVNSSHIVDMAFYLGGQPAEISSYVSGDLGWHKPSAFTGAGRTANGVVFSYMANWDAPGRWNIEMMTKNYRLIFKPIEDLSIQPRGSVQVQRAEFDDSLDKKFKPGLFLQTKNFLEGNYKGMKSIAEQAAMLPLFNTIRGTK